MTNPFEALAEALTVHPVKVKQERAERRRQRAAEAEKELAEEAELSKLYRRWRKERVEALLTGPHGREVRGLLSFCRTMTLSSAPALIDLVRRAAWVRGMSEDERHDLLQEIGRHITRLRVKEGLPPLDDALPGEPPKAFEQIREMFGVR